MHINNILVNTNFNSLPTPIKFKPFNTVAIIKAPKRAPIILPLPPSKLTPPITAAAILSNRRESPPIPPPDETEAPKILDAANMPEFANEITKSVDYLKETCSFN